MKQLTREQAIAFSDSEAWKQLDVKARAILQLQQNRLCMPISVFHQSIEEALGRPVCTYEFGLNMDGLLAELEGKIQPPSFEDILALLPADKTVVILTE